jgi:glycine hydroxymethyltransferase
LDNAKSLSAGLTNSGYRIISGGTDSHLVLMDVFSKGLKGKEAEAALDRAHITVNKNAIPFDTNPPLNPSGIRLGTAALTTRGFGQSEFAVVASLIAEALAGAASEEALASVRRKVADLTERFPLYSWRMAAASVR